MRRITKTLIFSVTSLGSVAYLDWANNYEFKIQCKRNIRTIITAADIINNYYWKKKASSDMVWHELHEYASEKMIKLFKANGGIYIKIGQHLASLDYLIPPEYCQKMKILYQSAPISSQEDIDIVIKDELGQTREGIFSYFDTEPIGAASLAQVHVAILQETGEKVAVKVQHKNLQKSAANDIRISSFLFEKIKYIFPDFEFAWLADEIRTNLPKEMKFLNEANNADLMRTKMNGLLGVIVIPRIFYKYSSKRILTMELIDGIEVTDLERLSHFKISGTDVCKRISDMICRMIFHYQLLHCDPHPGNLLRVVPRQCKKGMLRLFPLLGRPQWKLVLLDHGLYRQLSDDVILKYAKFWHYLMNFSESELESVCKDFGLDKANCQALSAIISQSTWTFLSSENILKKNQFDLHEFQKKSIANFPVIVQILSRLPRELLLVLKTNDIVRSLERKLTQSNSHRIFLDCTLTYSLKYLIHNSSVFSIWRRIKFSFQLIALILLKCIL